MCLDTNRIDPDSVLLSSWFLVPMAFNMSMWECSPSILSRILKNFSTDKGFVRKSCVVPGWFSFLLMILRDQSFPSHTTSEFLQLHTMSCRVAQEESVSPCRVNSKSSSLVIAYSRKSRYATDMSSKKVINTITNKEACLNNDASCIWGLSADIRRWVIVVDACDT